MLSEARKIARISNDCQLEIDEQKYVERFSAGAMNAIYLWAQGKRFGECVSDKNFEGSIVRSMRRLQELIKEMCAAAQAIGNGELEAKFQAATAAGGAAPARPRGGLGCGR